MSYITCTKEGLVARIRIHRPEALNALNGEIIQDLDTILDDLGADPQIRVVILHNGDNFAAGADIANMADYNVDQAFAFTFTRTFNKLEDLNKITIAAMEGFALGGGLELALACDFRIAGAKTRMAFPEINIGIMPGSGGTVRAARLMNVAKAKEMIFFGSRIGAEEAERYGLINRMVPEGQALATAEEWAAKLLQQPFVALQTAKATMNRAANMANVQEACDMERENWAELFRTEDQKEGMHAFLEKRKPAYKGR